MSIEDARSLLERPTVTVEQFAAIFGLSRAGAYDAIARGEIHATRIGSTIRVLTSPLAKRLGLNASD